jgi:hypothetical protein
MAYIGGKVKTRKHRVHSLPPGPKVCHPSLIGKNDDCLPDPLFNELSKLYGAPQSAGFHRGETRRWLTRKTKCKGERCLIKKSAMDPKKKKEVLKKYFRPEMPEEWKRDPDQWLDSNNIADVMKQYEEVYPEFKFYGTNPIDFAAPDPYDPSAAAKNKCLQDEICKLNLKELASQGKTKLGFVYNLDPSNKGGSHWIASFTDIPAHRTYYFDSYGMKPPPQIARFMRSLTLQDPSMKLAFNARRFQYGETECGMYSLYFLIRMLAGDDFKAFCRRAPRDGEMLLLRHWLFSPNE